MDAAKWMIGLRFFPFLPYKSVANYFFPQTETVFATDVHSNSINLLNPFNLSNRIIEHRADYVEPTEQTTACNIITNETKNF